MSDFLDVLHKLSILGQPNSIHFKHAIEAIEGLEEEIQSITSQLEEEKSKREFVETQVESLTFHNKSLSGEVDRLTVFISGMEYAAEYLRNENDKLKTKLTDAEDKADMLCDSSYVAGMKLGWNCCASEDDCTFNEIINARIMRRVEYKQMNRGFN